MNESPEYRIRRLKQERTLAKKALEVKKILGEKRELLENNINALVEEIDDETLKMHRQATDNDESAFDELSYNLKKKKVLLSQVKQTKQEMDRCLDEYDNFSQQVLEEIENGLAMAILELRPEQQATYQRMREELKAVALFREYVAPLEEDLNAIDAILASLQADKSQSKLKMILSHFTGGSAYAARAKRLHEGGVILNRLLPKIKSAAAASEVSGRCYDILSKVQHHLKQHSGYTKIHAAVVPLCDAARDAIASLREADADAEQHMNEIKGNIESWMERGSSHK